MRLGNKTYHFKEKMEIVAAYAGNKRRPSIKGYVRSWQTLNTKKNKKNMRTVSTDTAYFSHNS